ncbi:MAG: DUF6311 domain-containing protein [Vicinamibacterales bacterium]
MRASTPAAWAGTLGGGACGAAFLSWMAGWALVDPRNVEWLMKLDWVPHYFGWHYFRHEPWHWPPGTITGYYAPLGSSIGLTDAIPLAAYLLKPWSALLPAYVQYIGAWWLLCFTLQGALGARLVGRATTTVGLQVLGGLLFVLVPTLLARVGHAALCSHWLILWALLVATRRADQRLQPAEWAGLGLCAGLIQPYLAAMALPLLLAIAVDSRGAPPRRRIAAPAAALAATVAGWWLSGLFVLDGDGSLGAGGLGYYSMNLLAPVTPGGWSRLLPAVPVAGDGQVYEGFHYLGLGLLALVVIAAVLARRRQPAAPRLVGPAVTVTALLMTVFAVSPVVTLGARVLVDVNGPWFAPLAAFRSSGRFFWPLTYLLVLWAVTTVIRRTRPVAAGLLLTAAVAVQFYDLAPAHAARRATARDPAFQEWPRRFASAEWASAGVHRHLVLVPPPQCGDAFLPYEPVLRLAADLGMTVNVGVIARGDDGARRRYCAALDADIQAGRLESGRVYLVTAATAEHLAGLLGDGVGCEVRDGIWACTARGGERLQPATP